MVSVLKGGIGAGGVVMAVAAVCLLSETLQRPLMMAHGVVVGLFVGACGWAVYWWVLPWPTARVSAGLFLGADFAIVAATVVHADPLAAIGTTPLFAMTGCYLVFFHGPRVQLAHVVLATVAIVGTAGWLGTSSHPDAVPLAVSKALIALTVTVGVLPFMQFGFWLVRHSAVDSFTDPLTELANRRGLANYVTRAAAALTDAGSDLLCALIIDLDDFKGVNDGHGHHVGDAVIARSAARIRAAVRGSAFVARIGGEEFIVIDALPVAAAARVAERVRVAIAAQGDPPITASIGVAGRIFKPVEFDALFAAADRAMYAAKRAGGNQVIVDDDIRASRS